MIKRSAKRYQLFVTHHYFTGNCIRFRLSSTDVVLRNGIISLAQGWRTIFDAEPCIVTGRLHQAGGRMVTDGPEHLLVVIGDHGAENTPQAPDSHFGKLVRIEIETGDVEIMASGLRNPQGLARADDGVLWETEHGPQGGDELNVLRPGENYGWPLVTFGVGPDGTVRTASAVDSKTLGRHHGGFAKPVYSWVPSIGISSILVNDEKSFPLWKDDLLIASLNGTSLFRVRRHGTDVLYVEKIEFGDRILDMAKLPDGRIALLGSGFVYVLSRSYAPCGDGPEARRLRGRVPPDRSIYCRDLDGGDDPTTGDARIRAVPMRPLSCERTSRP